MIKFKPVVSSFWSASELLCYPILFFLLAPFFSKNLGSEKFAFWMFYMVLVNIGGFLNVGNSAASLKRLSTFSNNRQDIENRNTYYTGFIFLAIVSSLVLSFFLLSFFLFKGSFYFDKLGTFNELIIICSFAILGILFEAIDTSTASAIKALRKFQLSSILEITLRVSQFFISALAAYLSKSVFIFLGTFVILSCIKMVVKLKFSFKYFEVVPINNSLKHVLNDIKGNVYWGWLLGLSGLFYSVFDRLYIASVLGSSSLNIYSISVQLSSQVHTISAAAISIFMPYLSSKFSDNEVSSLKIGKKILYYNLAISTALSLIIYLLLPVFYFFYKTGIPNFSSNGFVIKYLLFSFWILALNVTPHYIYLAKGRFKQVAIFNLVASFISVVTLSLFYQTFGLNGVLYNKILYSLILSFLYLFSYIKDHYELFAKVD